MRLLINYGSISFLCGSAIILIALQLHVIGWILLSIGLALLPFCQKHFAKDLLLLYISIALLGVTPISTDISNMHILIMSTTLGMAVLLPYLVSRFVYKDYLVRFKFHHGRCWYKTEIFYILFTTVVGFFLLPFMLHSTGSYHNWTVIPGVRNLLVLFIGTQALGLWDELFFISTTLGILRRHFPFYFANIFQAIMMASFLYELGFRGWAFGVTFVFSLIQGYVFRKTESLFYVITIHLTLDLVLYLVLIHAYYPTWLPIFFT
jgi:hypothetical protein